MQKHVVFQLIDLEVTHARKTGLEQAHHRIVRPVSQCNLKNRANEMQKWMMSCGATAVYEELDPVLCETGVDQFVVIFQRAHQHGDLAKSIPLFEKISYFTRGCVDLGAPIGRFNHLQTLDRFANHWARGTKEMLFELPKR